VTASKSSLPAVPPRTTTVAPTRPRVPPLRVTTSQLPGPRPSSVSELAAANCSVPAAGSALAQAAGGAGSSSGFSSMSAPTGSRPFTRVSTPEPIRCGSRNIAMASLSVCR
jgi:hypothetical protein